MAVALAVLAGFVLALPAPWLQRRCGRATGWLLALTPLALAGFFAGQLGSLVERGAFSVSYPWLPSLGIQLSFLVDGLSVLMALLISGIGALVLVYAGGYLEGHPQLGRMFAFLLVFMGSMLGVVLADNVITLFVFWELTSLSSYLLIGFDHERAAARSAALQALLVTGAGGLALLAGLLLLGHVGGSYELSVLLSQGDRIRESSLYLPILLLVLLGAFTKSAQFPFHFWLPHAMEAPTPVSAYLHSATMVKAGVYLLARLTPILGGTLPWTQLVTGFGVVTMLIGALLAMQQTDLKRILAYSTVSALGVLTMLLGIGTEAAVTAAVVFLLAHALYKGALFLVAGAVDHETGTRNVDALSGLWRSMPIVSLAAGLAALSMAGLPPLFGFIAKELVYETALAPAVDVLLTGAVAGLSMLSVAAAVIVGVRPFLGQPSETPKHPHEAPLSLWLGPVVLSALGLFFGLLPFLVDEALLGPAAAAIRGRQAEVLHLSLWHGLTPALGLSAVTLVGGLGCFALRHWFRWLEPLNRWGPGRAYELVLHGLNTIAQLQTRVLQSGYLRHYLIIVLATFTGLVGWTMQGRLAGIPAPRWDDLRFIEVSLIGLTVAAALLTVRPQPRLAAIATLGVVGYSIALLFVLYGAPDLAMTQFLVETLTVILFVLVFYHLPSSPDHSEFRVRLRDAGLALAVGLVMTIVVLTAAQTQFQPSIADYFATNSLTEAHGRNVVNVILVDYRGLDTLGEITVLAVAAVGVHALLKLRPRPAPPALGDLGAVVDEQEHTP